MRKATLLLIYLLLLSFAKAQMLDPISIPSPTSASLGTYGGSPIKNYTGGVDISLPLYKMKNGLPIQVWICK